MEDNVLAQSNRIATAEETRTLEGYLAEILRLRSEIDADQEEIERIKAENQELKAETCAILTTLRATILTGRESIALKPATASFRQGWQEAQQGDTYPIATLWDDIDAE